MDLAVLISLPVAVVLLVAAGAAFVYLRIFRRYMIRCCSQCREPDDLELGARDARVTDGPDSEPDTRTKAELDKEGGGDTVARRFAWHEIESLTSSFAPATVVGEGGFSTVYLVRIPNGGGDCSTRAAVKLHRSSERLHRAFRQELDVLLRLRHPHIVRLLGYCDEREEGVLVFEYVPNGSLHEKLHVVGTAGVVLPWTRRMAIAYQLAAALDYLHDGCDLQIVHGDIKASNVLLDDHLEPKLIDFGFARMGFSATVQPAGGRAMMGSPGYVDPHYLRSGLVSKKSDVYSFGVLLLELITGLEAFITEKEQRLTAAMGPVLREAGRRAGEMVDPRLNGDFDAGEAAAMAAVAAACVGDNPSLRPSMAEVIRIMREKVAFSDFGR